jgi:two-component system C4-dicarboxylate transport sensor histidine kinase DctB
VPLIRLPRWLVWLAVALVPAILAGLIAGGIAERRAVAALAERTAADAQLRAALLDSELGRFRLLPLTLGADRDVVAAIGGGADARRALDRKLEALAGATGAAAIYLVGADGVAVSASNWRARRSFVGSDYRFRRYYRDAARTGAASQFALGTVSGRPGLYLARRTVVGGVIVVKLEFDRIEREWGRAGGITYVTDADGVVVVTSVPRWRFATTRPLSAPAIVRFRIEANKMAGALSPLPVTARPGGRTVAVDGRRMVAATASADEPGWRLTLLQPTHPSVTAGPTWISVGVALAVLTVALLAFAVRTRAALVRQRTVELERAVAERTVALRHEIEERIAGEARAATLREGLRQANRLATLGQVTASVAHETAQPVAAIRAYAQAGETLLDRGQTDEVRANLVAIARLTDRIGAVTTQLRGFARRTAGELRPVPLSEVIDGAMLILKEQLRDVTLDLPTVDPGLSVIGGRVRLEQVLVNLLQNAAEALAGRDDPHIALTVEEDAETVRLSVCDNGAGVSAEVAGRLFTPFVTSRPNGLGLGLVIAHDIMVDLGGTLRHRPGDAGARFEMTMRRSRA